MAIITVGEYYSKTRTLLDVGTDELPDELLSTFLQDGFDRIISRQRNWRHLEASEDWTTTVGDNTFQPSEIIDVRSVVNIEGVWAGQLQNIPYEVGETVWVGDRDIPAWPGFWAWWDGQITVYPTPDAEYSMRVRGYRDVHDFIADGAGGTPDLPTKFHPALWYWVVSLSYLQQEDPDMSATYSQMHEAAVSNLMKSEERGPTSQPFIMHGGRLGRNTSSYDASMNRVTWAGNGVS